MVYGLGLNNDVADLQGLRLLLQQQELSILDRGSLCPPH
jgi:hypothetical protein